MKGFINIIKPQGMSSAAAVSVVKRKLNSPCGHMGTLDPMASGVLPIGVGKASRLFDYLLDKEKIYRSKFLFGFTTDTLDVTGEVTGETSVIPTVDDINKVIRKFIGEIDQVPPNYSAKCVDGKRGYQLARKGVEFSLPPKRVTVLNFECIEQVSEKEFVFEIKCKGGTYIRSLARDLGESLNSLCVMSELIRVKSGVFDMQNGVTLEEFKNAENPLSYLLPADIAVNFPKAKLNRERAQRILDGIFDFGVGADGLYSVYAEDEFWGIGEEKDGILRIKSYVR